MYSWLAVEKAKAEGANNAIFVEGAVDRTAAPVALRRVTRGVTAVIFSAGRRSASLVNATITGVIAVATSVPCCQISGTTTAAATADSDEMTSVWTEIPLFFSRSTPLF